MIQNPPSLFEARNTVLFSFVLRSQLVADCFEILRSVWRAWRCNPLRIQSCNPWQYHCIDVTDVSDGQMDCGRQIFLISVTDCLSNDDK